MTPLGTLCPAALSAECCATQSQRGLSRAVAAPRRQTAALTLDS
eukprot:CAMPEP_0114121382 /NCGR_PEP_ID=MMETSP0043_2-20121206/7149_1 /TAXON_ID=464988 /ORGANISM="Hemiselmis andersenii, Strain CCMP644" /LENGTH=43 /DNA_ID= /DNA_START= /DNA_END= /DNA_ORIENTATION=